MKYYTIKFFVNLESVCATNALPAFIHDCSDKIGWDLSVEIRKAGWRIFEVSAQFEEDQIFGCSTSYRDAMALFLNRGKRYFDTADYEISYIGNGWSTKEIRYSANGARW
jgi:hypothetical protein